MRQYRVRPLATSNAIATAVRPHLAPFSASLWLLSTRKAFMQKRPYCWQARRQASGRDA